MFFRAAKNELIDADLDDGAVLERFRRELDDARKTPRYNDAYEKKSPLVTICITTSDRAELLRERALASMLRQTYRNIQVIVVGDACADATARVIRDLRDRRFSFTNLAVRGPYPRPGRDRHLVAGTYPANVALAAVKGDFVTHIDEDDTFRDDRIALLVAAIQRFRADLVYHPFWWENEDRSLTTRGDGSFQLGETGTSMVFYHRWFARVPFDVMAYRKGEPGDWNRFRKFQALGARLAFVPELLTWHWCYPLRDEFVAKPGETYLD